MFSNMSKFIFVASMLGVAMLSAGAENPGAPAVRPEAGIQMSQWGAETVLPEFDAPAITGIPRAEFESPSFGEFLAEESRIFAAGAMNPDQLRKMLANRAIGREDSSVLLWMSSRWESAPGRVAGFFADNAEARLESMPWVESADLNWTPNENNWAAFSASGVGLLHRGANSVFGIQPNIERTEAGDKLLGSFGVFHRRAFDGWGVGGVNMFADYAGDQRNGEFMRWSLGADFRSPWADAFVNRYFGGDSARELTFGIRREMAYAPDGLDAEFRLHAPGREWVGGFARFSQWDGRFGQKDDAELAYGITFAPAHGPLAGLRAEMSTGDSAMFEIKYGRILGAENSFAPIVAAPFATERAMTAPAVRENEIFIRNAEIAETPPFSPAFEARQFVTDNAVPSYLRDAYDDCQWSGEIADWLNSAPPANLITITGHGWAMSVTAAASRDSNFENLCQALRFQGNPNHRDGQNNTPLHTAAGSGALKNVKLLVLAGADPALENDDGKTPLDRASDFFDLIARGDGVEYCENASLSNTKGKFCEIGRILRANGGECQISAGPLCNIDDGGYSPLNHRNFAVPGRHIPASGILTVTMHSELQAYSADDNYLNADSPFFSDINTPAAVLLNLVDAETFSQESGIALTTLLGYVNASQQIDPYSGGVRVKYAFDKPPLVRAHSDGFVSPYTYREQEQNHGGRTPIAEMGVITVTGMIEYSTIADAARTLSLPGTILVTVVDPSIAPPSGGLRFRRDHTGEVFRTRAILRAGNVRFALEQTGNPFTLSVSGKEVFVQIPTAIAEGEHAATLRAHFSRDGTALNTAELAFTVTLVNIPISAHDSEWSAPQTRFFAPGYSGVLFSVTATTPVSDVGFAISAQSWDATISVVRGSVAVIGAATGLAEGANVGTVYATLRHGNRNLITLTARFTVTAIAPVAVLNYYTPPDFSGYLGSLSFDDRLGDVVIQAERPDAFHLITVNQSGQILLQLPLTIGRLATLVLRVTSPAMLGTMRVTIHALGKCVVPANIANTRSTLSQSRSRTLDRNLYNAVDTYDPPDDMCRYLRQGADPDYSFSIYSPLIKAGYDNLSVQASILLDFNADADMQVGSTSKKTALHAAASANAYEFAQVLIGRGAKVTMEDGNEQTPLHALAKARNYADHQMGDFAQLLINHGANVNARDSQGRTALYLSIQYGSSIMTDALVRNNANPNIGESYKCLTPLHKVSTIGKARILLGAAGINVNLKVKYKDGHSSSAYPEHSTPLDLVRNSAIRQLLRDNGGCYGSTDGATPACPAGPNMSESCLPL